MCAGLFRAEGIMNLSSVKHCGQSQRNEFSYEVEGGSSFLKGPYWLFCQPILSPSSSILHNVFPLLKFNVSAYPNGRTEEKGARPKSQKVVCKPDKTDDSTKVSGMCSSCDNSIDFFWPFCMFELRGKCNNDECPWQHVKQNSKRSLKRGLLVTHNSGSSFEVCNYLVKQKFHLIKNLLMQILILVL